MPLPRTSLASSNSLTVIIEKVECWIHSRLKLGWVIQCKEKGTIKLKLWARQWNNGSCISTLGKKWKVRKGRVGQSRNLRGSSCSKRAEGWKAMVRWVKWALPGGEMEGVPWEWMAEAEWGWGHSHWGGKLKGYESSKMVAKIGVKRQCQCLLHMKNSDQK